MKHKSLFFKKSTVMDYQSVLYVVTLVGFGILMVYSASSFVAARDYDNKAYYAMKQFIAAIIGFVGMYVISRIRYQYFKYITKILLIFAGVLLLLVFIIGTARNGSTRWIYIGPISFQPSEFAKFALVLYMAHICTARQKQMETFIGTMKLFIYPIIIILIIAVENLSTAVICAAICGGVWFVSTPKPKYFFAFLGIGAVLVIILIFSKGYRGDRLTVWRNPEASDKGYQTMQALYAISSGGFFGRGLGQSIQKRGFIPEAQNDMIFSIICEELGIFGAAAFVILFLLLLWRFKYIAENTRDLYGALIVVGVICHIAAQALLNMCVVTLPFISYGGTSLSILLAEIGLVLSVSRQIYGETN